MDLLFIICILFVKCEKDKDKKKPDSPNDGSVIVIPEKQDTVSLAMTYYSNVVYNNVRYDGRWFGSNARHFLKKPIAANFHVTYKVKLFNMNSNPMKDTFFLYTIKFYKDSLKNQFERSGGYQPDNYMTHFGAPNQLPTEIAAFYPQYIYVTEPDSVICDNPQYLFNGFYWGQKIEKTKYVKKL